MKISNHGLAPVPVVISPINRVAAKLCSVVVFCCGSATAWSATDDIAAEQTNSLESNYPEANYSDAEVVEVLGVQEPLTTVKTERLLKVPGSGNDPMRAIGSLPGVVFSSAQSSEPAVRGSSPDDNAFYLDFFEVGYIFHTDASSIISDNALGDFALLPAAFGPQYNGATGAVIEADSRRPDFGNRQAVLDLSFLKAGIFVEQPTGDNQGFYLSARQSLFQYYIENLLDDEEFQFTTVPEYYDYQGKYEYAVSNTESITFNIIGARDKAGLLFDEDSDQVQQDPGLSGGIGFEQYFNSQALLWEKIHAGGLQQKIGLSQLEEKLQFRIGTDNHIDVKVNDYTLKSQFTDYLSLDHEVTFGVELGLTRIGGMGRYAGPPCDEFQADCRLVDGTQTLASNFDETIYSLDVGAVDHWQVTDDWNLSPGLLVSVEDYTNEWFIEPKLDSDWRFAPFWNLNTGFGQYHDFPDNFGQYDKNFGNPELKLPSATHWVIGIEHELRSDLLIKLDSYYKTMEGLVIARQSQDNYSDLTLAQYNNLPRYTNEAHGKAWGLELFVNKDLSDHWYGWASLAWSRTQRTNEITGEDFRYSYDQPVVINAVAGYEFNDRTSIGLKWRYQSGQLITPLTGAEQDTDNAQLYNPTYGELNSERLPAYHTLDARIDRLYVYDGWEMTLYGEVINLYGRDNVIDYQYKNADYSEREEVTDLPTLISVGVKLVL